MNQKQIPKLFLERFIKLSTRDLHVETDPIMKSKLFFHYEKLQKLNQEIQSLGADLKAGRTGELQVTAEKVLKLTKEFEDEVIRYQELQAEFNQPQDRMVEEFNFLINEVEKSEDLNEAQIRELLKSKINPTSWMYQLL